MRKFLILGMVALLAAGCGGGGGGSGGPGDPGDTAFLTADVRGISALMAPGAGIPAPPGGSADFGAVADDARTEIVRAIEEADLYRVSGDLLYLLSSYRGLTVVDLARLELRGHLALAGVPLEMYLRDNRALVLLAGLQGGTQLVEMAVADPARPAISRSESMTGFYRTSRLIGDVLYAVTDRQVESFLVSTAPFVPVSSLALANNAGFAHASGSHIFIAGSNAGNGTTVTLVDVSDPAGAIALRGSLHLPGYVSDDQKLNFGGGVLRVVTHDRTDSGLSRLFTVDITDPDAPAVLASLELARGEQLFATQFTADRAYIVTFEQVDPLWVIDLSDPRRPTLAGELVVPGYATQMVADGNQLVTIGVDPALGWRTSASLFDVSNPAAPELLDREDVGDSSATAVWDRKAFGVFPGLILVPRWDGLAVVERAATSLTLRGLIDVAGGALRGFPHGDGIVAAGSEEVVMAHAATLNAIGRVTIAENVVDVGRLGDGTLLRLVQAGSRARLGGAEVEIWAEAFYPYGQSAVIVGWDTTGRAAYVVDFRASPAVVSARLDLGSGAAVPVGGIGEGAAPPDFAGGGAAFIAPVFSGAQAVLTSSGKLVLRGLPSGDPSVFGDGTPMDGLTVIDIRAAALGKGVAVRDAAITGFVADDATLAFTFAKFAGQDSLNRPLLEHDYVRIDLDAGTFTPAVNVPGYVVAAAGSDVFTVEDHWKDDWSVTSTVVAARTVAGGIEVRDRLALPDGAYDLRAAGGTLFFARGGGFVVPMLDGLDRPGQLLPESEIGTIRLGAGLALGPVIGGTGAFRTLLLPEEGAALVSRDGLTVEHWDVAGAAADLSWSVGLPAYPLRAHADMANPGRYLVALGYAGDLTLP
jgi:hypothetical protein